MSDTETPFDDLVTPRAGAMDSSEHAAFMLRVFQYIVCISPMQSLEVDLRDVLAVTKGKTLMVALDGPKFKAVAINEEPKFRKGKIHGH